MSHGVLGDARFWSLLVRLDEDLASEVQRTGCACGGRLDRGDWPRKPRGGPATLDAAFRTRIGLCCARDGCRVRTRPPSVRFFGRRVYLGAIVVLATALRYGASRARLAQLRAWFGMTAVTLTRWRTWWTETFPQTAFWRAASGRFVPPVASERLPMSLMERFARDTEASTLECVLRFLTPLTRSSPRRESS